jgi:hypothetical protein
MHNLPQILVCILKRFKATGCLAATVDKLAEIIQEFAQLHSHSKARAAGRTASHHR